jgi:N-lysine methyltransferase SETD6
MLEEPDDDVETNLEDPSHETTIEDDEEGETADDVAMVPMADILNARYGCNNV